MLKPLNDVTKPDPWFLGVAGPTGLPMTIADHHAAISEVRLNPGAPESIASAFVAETQAYSSLEMALRFRLGFENDPNPPRLHSLLERAVAKKLMLDGPAPGEPNLAFLLATLRNNRGHGSSDLLATQGGGGSKAKSTVAAKKVITRTVSAPAKSKRKVASPKRSIVKPAPPKSKPTPRSPSRPGAR